jgi:hypothetical protein
MGGGWGGGCGPAVILVSVFVTRRCCIFLKKAATPPLSRQLLLRGCASSPGPPMQPTRPLRADQLRCEAPFTKSPSKKSSTLAAQLVGAQQAEGPRTLAAQRMRPAIAFLTPLSCVGSYNQTETETPNPGPSGPTRRPACHALQSPPGTRQVASTKWRRRRAESGERERERRCVDLH